MPKRKARKPPKIGSVFETSFHGRAYELRVIADGQGIAFELKGKTFGTPTGAAKSITKHEVNGWKFWNMD